MDRNEEIQNELDDISPELAQLRKRQHQSFAAPANYFDGVPSEMQAYVREKTAPKTRGGWMLPIWEWAPWGAAFMFLLGISFYFLSKPGPEVVTNIPVTESMEEASITYEEVILEELDEDFLVSALAMTQSKKTTSVTHGDAKEEIDKKEIEEYILENFDESILTDQL